MPYLVFLDDVLPPRPPLQLLENSRLDLTESHRPRWSTQHLPNERKSVSLLCPPIPFVRPQVDYIAQLIDRPRRSVVDKVDAETHVAYVATCCCVLTADFSRHVVSAATRYHTPGAGFGRTLRLLPSMSGMSLQKLGILRTLIKCFYATDVVPTQR